VRFGVPALRASSKVDTSPVRKVGTRATTSKRIIMTAKNLSTVATDIVQTYGKAAINAITTYRVGTERLIDFVDRRVATVAVGGASRIGGELRSNVMDAQKRVRGLYLKGVTDSATRAQGLVTTAVRVASAGVERLASYAGRVGGSPSGRAVEMMARAALPAANAFSSVAERVEGGSDRLVKRVAQGRSAIQRPVVVRAKATRTKVVAAKRKLGAQPAKAAKRSSRSAR
jgi:hypothetical protein